MKLVGELKKQVEETNSKEKAKELIEKAGMELTDDELDSVAGGLDFYGECSQGGNHNWTTKFDSEAHKLVRYCTKCEESLEFGITSI